MKKLITFICALCWCVAAWADELPVNLRKSYNDAYLAVLAASGVVETYSNNSNGNFSYLKSCGWQVQTYATKNKKLDVFYTLAANRTRDGKKIYLLTIKGSTSKKDWKINVQTEHTFYGGNNLAEMRDIAKITAKENQPTVHGGFNAYVDYLLDKMVLDTDGVNMKGIFAEVKNDPNTRLILVGHSMGGAVATLLAERLYDLGLPSDRFRVITFGAPAIGNSVFAEQYGDRINLVRYTNSADPVPGSLQTVFGNYKQFGDNRKYHIAASVANNQHDSALYLDYAVSEFYKVMDNVEFFLGCKILPQERVVEGVPKVGLVVFASPEARKYKYVPDIQRFVIGQYMRLFPSYKLMVMNVSENSAIHNSREVLRQAEQAGCDYVLFCGIDGHLDKKGSEWYIELTQSFSTVKNQLLTMSSYAKRVNPASGNIQAAGENLVQAQADLSRAVNFLSRTQTVNLLTE